MKNLILLLFIPLLFACNSNKESIDKLFKGQTVEPKPNPISNSDSEYSFAATITGNKKLEVKNGNFLIVESKAPDAMFVCSKLSYEEECQNRFVLFG